MSRAKFLYRGTAYYRDQHGDYFVLRHFQSKGALDRWVANRLEGYPSDPEQLSLGGRPAIPPAFRVDTARSDRVVFTEEV